MKSVLANGIHVAFEVHGEGDPVLCVHGFPLSRKLWEHMIAPLSARYSLLMPDLRGMGDSDATDDATMATYADDLAALLDVLREKRPVVLVGLSMGGYI